MTNAKESIEMINEMSTNSYNSLRQLSDINMMAWNKLMENQMDVVTSLMENSIEQMKLISEAKDYQEVVRGQMDMTRKLGETVLDKTRETVELAQKTGEDYRTWIEGSMANANEQLAKAAEKAA